MSLTQPLASGASVQNTGLLKAEYEKKFDGALAEIRTQKIALGVLVGLTTLAVAGLALSIAAWAIVPLSIASGYYLVLLALVVATAAALALYHRNHELANSNEKLQNLFGELLRYDRGRLSEEKMKLFEKYGVHCTKLDGALSSLEIGVELGVFFDWLLDEKRAGAITNPQLREFLQSLNTDENRKLLKSRDDLVCPFYMTIQFLILDFDTLKEAEDLVPKDEKDVADKKEIIDAYPAQIEAKKKEIIGLLDKVGNRSFICQGFRETDTVPKDQLCSRQQVVDLINLCPNLKEISPSVSMEHHSVIREAYTKIGAVADKDALDFAKGYANLWEHDFPGIKV
jgi:hypothetical protein